MCSSYAYRTVVNADLLQLGKSDPEGLLGWMLSAVTADMAKTGYAHCLPVSAVSVQSPGQWGRGSVTVQEA